MIRRRNNINPNESLHYSPYDQWNNNQQHAEYVGLILDDDEIQKRLRCCRPSRKCFLICLSPFILTFLLLCIVAAASSFNPKAFDLPTPAPLTGPIISNDLIASSIKLIKDEIIGSEGFLAEDDVLWVSTPDSRLLRVVNGRIEDTLQISETCSSLNPSHYCRPLSVRRLNTSTLLVVDAYRGIYSVDYANRKVSVLLPSSSPIDRLTTLHYIHDVAVINNDNIVLTERSTKYSPHFKPYERMEHQPNGRLFHYEISRNRITLLLDGLYEPAGVEVAQDRDHIIFAETGRGEVLNYNMRTKSLTRFTENLPGLPSLVRLNEYRDALWVGMEEARLDEVGAPKSLPEYLKDWPFIFPSEVFKGVFNSFMPPHLLAVKYDMQGNALVSVQAPRGIPQSPRVKGIAQISETPEGVFLSFTRGNHIAKIQKRYIDVLQKGIASSARRRG